MVNGIAQVRAMFRRKGKLVMAAGLKAARTGGEEVAQEMRILAPEDERELIASIRVEDTTTIKTRSGESGFIGVKVVAGNETTVVRGKNGHKFQNAKLQEVGTQDMPANPYFNAAWRNTRKRVRGRITRAVSTAWKQG